MADTDEGEKPRPRDLAEALTRIEGDPIGVETIRDETEIPLLIPAYYMDKARKEAQYRTQKWVKKRGYNLDEEAKGRVLLSFTLRCLLDEAMGTVLGYYGVGAGLSVMCRGLGYRVAKIITETKEGYWEKRITEEIETWRRKYQLDEKTLKAVALVSAKVSYWYPRQG